MSSLTCISHSSLFVCVCPMCMHVKNNSKTTRAKEKGRRRGKEEKEEREREETKIYDCISYNLKKISTFFTFFGFFKVAKVQTKK